MSRTTRLKIYLVVTAITSALLMTGTALAHTRIVKGDYAFVLGWLDEPPVAGLKNAALIAVSTVSDNKPVTGAEGTLTAQIQYGGKTRDLLLRPLAGSPGTYVGDFIPTRRGTYTLKIGGTLNNQPIDLSGDIEEVGSTDSLAFPEPVNSDLQKSIDDLRSAVTTSQIVGITGMAVGLIGLALIVVLFRRKRV
ncbi:MAG TPA: hypothetical protein VMP08_26400 [Anaerolineae bacterium]|nr:hypothetical protein [Anaerolineae bacterium]